MALYCLGEVSLSCLQNLPGLPTYLPVRLGPRFTSMAAQAAPACLHFPKATLPPPQYMLFLLPGELFPTCYLTAPAYPQTSVQVSSNPVSLSPSGPQLVAPRTSLSQQSRGAWCLCGCLVNACLLPENRGLFCFCSLLYPQCLVPHPVESKNPVSICRVRESSPESSMGATLPGPSSS